MAHSSLKISLCAATSSTRNSLRTRFPMNEAVKVLAASPAMLVVSCSFLIDASPLKARSRYRCSATLARWPDRDNRLIAPKTVPSDGRASEGMHGCQNAVGYYGSFRRREREREVFRSCQGGGEAPPQRFPNEAGEPEIVITSYSTRRRARRACLIRLRLAERGGFEPPVEL